MLSGIRSQIIGLRSCGEQWNWSNLVHCRACGAKKRVVQQQIDAFKEKAEGKDKGNAESPLSKIEKQIARTRDEQHLRKRRKRWNRLKKPRQKTNRCRWTWPVSMLKSPAHVWPHSWKEAKPRRHNSFYGSKTICTNCPNSRKERRPMLRLRPWQTSWLPLSQLWILLETTLTPSRRGCVEARTTPT